MTRYSTPLALRAFVFLRERGPWPFFSRGLLETRLTTLLPCCLRSRKFQATPSQLQEETEGEKYPLSERRKEAYQSTYTSLDVPVHIYISIYLYVSTRPIYISICLYIPTCIHVDQYACIQLPYKCHPSLECSLSHGANECAGHVKKEVRGNPRLLANHFPLVSFSIHQSTTSFSGSFPLRNFRLS